jgi:UDP-N-acetylmuramoylalanine--D-glutamate ligase
MDDLRNKRVTVAGLGRFGGGIAVARWLVQQGARVRVTDRDPAEKLADSVQQLAGLPIEFRLGGHEEKDFTGCDLVVTSPAVPPSSPYLQAARAAGVPITTEIRLFLERCPSHCVVGVTGTKGKSTTTALLGLMLQKRRTTWVGGNIGKSLLADLPSITRGDIVLLELSSYMLEYLRPMNWSPHVAVVTLISRDHLEWHGSFEAYLDAKKNLVRYQSSDDFAVLSEDNALSRSFADETDAKVSYYGLTDRKPFALQLPGQHNQLNAQAAFEAASKLGVTWDDAQSAIADFPGLSHRLQLVHESAGVRYFNDSIATIPEAAVVACEAFAPGTVIQIVGGSDKQLDMSPMCEALARRAKAVLGIGKLGPSLATATAAVPDCTARVMDCETLAAAVRQARELARPGDVVLLSTGCASYDQFVNFEQRGDEFARLVKSAAN